MASLFSAKQQSRRALKRSNPLFFREMTHVASTGSSLPCSPRIDKEKTSTYYLVVSIAACLSSKQRCSFVIFLASTSNFLNRCPK
jgi:hypothetical protein